jgi:hypothetical protein
MENPAITNLINKLSLNHSISMNIHNSLKSLHFHVTLSWIQTKNLYKCPVSTRFRFIQSLDHPISLRQKLFSFGAPKKAVFASVVERLAWLRSFEISPSMQRPRKHSDDDFGHGREHFYMKWDK